MNPADLPPEKEPWWSTAGGRWMLVGLTLLLLVVAFYAEENWRGEAAWNQAKADIAAAGESIDPDHFYPSPVRDEKNFGALPIFQLAPDPSSTSYPRYLMPAPLNLALSKVEKIPISPTDNLGPEQLPYLGRWDKGEVSDVAAIRKRLADLCKSEVPGASLNATTSLAEMFDLLAPALAELREENAKRPDCVFLHDDKNQLPFLRALSGITAQIKVAKVLSYQEQLALLDHRPQLALDDLRVEWKLVAGLRKEPSLIAGLVAIGVVAIQLGVIEQGLATHVWNDQELAELDHDLAQIDDLQQAQFCVRSDAVVFTIPTIDYLKTHHMEIRDIIAGGYVASPSTFGDEAQNLINSTLVALIPNGWFDQYKADSIRAHLLGTLKMVDPAAHRAFPDKADAGLHMIQSTKESSLWRDFLERFISGTLDSPKRFIYAQVQIDEARIACQLERYRLVHGQYPGALADLGVAELPNDVISGQAYRYRRQDDGTYLLYSVGWNKVDDKGAVGTGSYHDYLSDPDWVWRNHPTPTKTK